MEMLPFHAEGQADGLELVRPCGILAAGHGRRQVVGEDDGDGGVVIDRIQETRHAAVGEGGVADDRDGGMDARVGSALCHGDGSAHVHAGVDGPVRQQGAQGVAADVAEHPGIGKVFQDGVQGRIDIPVAASLAQLRRTRGQVPGRQMHFAGGLAQGLRHAVRRKFASTGKMAVQAAMDRILRPQQPPHLLFGEGLAVFHDEDFLTGSGEFPDKTLRKRILGYFQDGHFVGKGLPHIVAGNAASDDTEGRTCILQSVPAGILRPEEQFRLLVHKGGVLPLGVAGQKDPAGALIVGRQGVLSNRLPYGHPGAGMRQAGDDAHEDRQPHRLRKAEGIGHHVEALLLVGRLQDGNQGELPVEPGILLILGGVHRRIVGGDDYQAALHAGDGGIDEGIGTDVHAHMLHAHQGALPGIGHAQGRLHGRFLVGTPAAAHAPFPGERIVLDEFRNLGGRRPWIGIHAGQPGIQRPQGDRLVPEQQSFHCHVRFIQSVQI